MERWSAGDAVSSSSGSNARMRLLLRNCLALELSRPRVVNNDGCMPTDLWMYDAGYLLFQSFLASNAKCWWVDELPQATTELQFAGYVAPGVLLLQGTDKALQTVRNAYAKNVLKPPPTYYICGLGEVEEWWSRTSPKGHFTPLPEALCHVIMDLTEQGQAATQESVRARLTSHFPSMSAPAPAALYDALAQLQRDGRAYRTAKGFFVATPERRRAAAAARAASASTPTLRPAPTPRKHLLTENEAMLSLYGEMHTERDGDVTHQCVQTNLADVICGGNPNDKVLYGRPNKRRSSSCSPRSLDRRHSLRTLGGLLSSKRSLHRCSSTRSLSRTSKSSFKIYSDSGSSTDYPASTDSSPKKASLLSRLFRRSRSKTDTRDVDSGHDSSHTGELKTFSAQFPPSEWFNQRAIHLHCAATQTQPVQPMEQRIMNGGAGVGVSPCISYVSLAGASDGAGSIRSTSLTRRHRRHLSSDDTHHALPSMPTYTGSLPRSHNKAMKNGNMKKMEYPMSYSGPSSLESKKSFPSSGHSSLDSQDYVDSTTKRSHADLVRAQSLVKVYSLQSSPKSPHRLKSKPPIAESTSKLFQKPNVSTSKPPVTKHNLSNPTKAAPLVNSMKNTTEVENNSKRPSLDNPAAISMNPSNSNNSITLKVTTNTSLQNGGGTNTKVYVQNSNSPMKSIITFENGNENPSSNNVYIINGERSQNQQPQKNATETSFENQAPIRKDYTDEKHLLKNNENIPKINKNEANLNNNRKMCLQMGNNATTNGLIFKNQLKSDNIAYKDNTSNTIVASPTKSFENISFENLKYYEKNSPKSQKNSCTDIKNMDLLKKPANDLDSIKNNTKCQKSDKRCKSEISLDVEASRAENNANSTVEYLKTIGKKRLSLRTDAKTDEASFDFPSLSDLSYNFTSLTAQKILKGVSLNSVDTLVELNMVEKQNNCDFTNDLGVV